MVADILKEKILPPPARDKALTAALAREMNIAPVTAELLLSRGILSAAEARRFFEPGEADICNPLLLPGMPAAVARVTQAIRENEKIVVHGDYDVDGITATALLCRALKKLGANVDFYVPHRVNDGYGLSADGVREIHRRGAKLMITVDCGITAPVEVALARELGVDVVITDHHLPHGPLPEAAALVNPKLPGSAYPNEHLSGAGVAYKLADALGGLHGSGADELLPLAAAGLCADAVTLTGENRLLVKRGLALINAIPPVAFAALVAEAGLAGKPISTWNIAFQLAPMINAAGRLGDAGRAVQFFLNDDPAAARAEAAWLKSLNTTRKQLEQSAAEECEAALEREGLPHFFTLFSDRWHPGVIGIVASRLLEKYHRPALVISLKGEKGRGSLRTPPDVDAVEALTFCADLLDSYGGHRQAGGLSVDRSRLPALKERLEQFAVEKRALSATSGGPRINTEAEISDLSLLTPGFLREVRRFEPFGAGNPAPVFLSRTLRVSGTPRIVGERHLKFKVAQNGNVLDVIAFRMGGRLLELTEGQGPAAYAYTLEENEWNGRKTLQLNIKGMA